MGQTRLFVRSQKADSVIGFNPGSYYTKAHSLTKTEFILPPQDAQAKDLLKKSGFDFDLVDLSKGMRTGLIARIRGVKETPTLEVGHGSARRYVGLKAISDYVSGTRKQIQSDG